jgi:hypothetical protein
MIAVLQARQRGPLHMYLCGIWRLSVAACACMSEQLHSNMLDWTAQLAIQSCNLVSHRAHYTDLEPRSKACV